MGVYSMNRISNLSENYEVELPEEPYEGTIAGCYEAMIDMETNAQMIFEATIGNDFLEASYILHQDEESLEGFYEASAVGTVRTLRNILLKFWGKIKALIHKFTAKMTGANMKRMGEKSKKVYKGLMKKDLSEFKYKMSPKKSGGLEKLYKAASGESLKAMAFEAVRAIDLMGGDKKEYKEGMNELYSTEQIIGAALSGAKISEKSFKSDIHDMCYDDAKSYTGLSTSTITSLFTSLQGNEKVASNLRKLQEENNKYFQTLLREVDKATKAASKFKVKKEDRAKKDFEHTYDLGDKGDQPTKVKMNKKEYVGKAGKAQSAIIKIESMHNRLVSAYLSEFRFGVKQASKILAAAASFKDGKKKDDKKKEEEVKKEAALYNDIMLPIVMEDVEAELDMIFELDEAVTVTVDDVDYDAVEEVEESEDFDTDDFDLDKFLESEEPMNESDVDAELENLFDDDFLSELEDL